MTITIDATKDTFAVLNNLADNILKHKDITAAALATKYGFIPKYFVVYTQKGVFCEEETEGACWSSIAESYDGEDRMGLLSVVAVDDKYGEDDEQSFVLAGEKEIHEFFDELDEDNEAEKQHIKAMSDPSRFL